MRGRRVIPPGKEAIAILLMLPLVACPAERKPSSSPHPQSSKPTESPLARKRVTPNDTRPTVAPFYVSSLTKPPSGVTCPDSWLYFDNPAGHYGFCYPSGWGFLDARTNPYGADRLTRIPGWLLEDMQMLSSEGFPWHPGDYVNDSEVKKNLVDLELGVYQPGTTFTDCTPSRPITISGLTGHWCETSYDNVSGISSPSPQGRLHLVILVLPLRRQWGPGVDSEWHADAAPDPGDGLSVMLSTTRTRYERDHDMLWTLLRTIRPY